LILNTFLIADEQVIVASTEDEIQTAVHAVKNLATKYSYKTKARTLE
jgi:hypothetical protein